MAATATGLALLGFAVLFGGEALGAGVLGIATPGPLAPWLGGALLGLGAMSWIGRGLPLGGIYGRAIVAANQIHFVVGALTLLRHVVARGAGAGLWAVLGFYVLGALFFVALLRRSPRGGQAAPGPATGRTR
jgi:hypothetical protein